MEKLRGPAFHSPENPERRRGNAAWWAVLAAALAALGFPGCERPGLGQSGAAIPIEEREPARSEATVSKATVPEASVSKATVPGANGSGSLSPGAVGERREVVIVATSDLHGWITRDTLFPKGRPGGLAHLAPLIARLRQEHPRLILLDAGDTLQGAPNLTLRLHSGAAEPPAVLRLMERLGYDAMAVGNHDLEQGFRRIEAWAEASSFPWLAANVVGPDDAPAFPPYALLERDGVRVAVLGMTTPGTPAWVDADFIAGLRFLGLPETARRWVDHLREVERADLVIGLFHSGLDGWYDRSMAVRAGLALPNAAGEIADRGSGFDLIVSGHAHRLSPRRPADGDTPYAVPVVQPGARGNGLAVVRFRLRGAPGKWTVEGITRETLRASIEPDRTLLAMVGGELAATRAWLAEATRVSFAAIPEKAAFLACLGDLSHEAALRSGAGETAGGKNAAAASDGARSGTGNNRIGSGTFSLLPLMNRYFPPRPEEIGTPLRRAHLYRWMPFGNTLVRARVTARQMALLLGPYARYRQGLRARSSGVLHPGGLRPRIAEGGTEVTALAAEGGDRLLAPHRPYAVWLTNYHWNGGGGGLARWALLQPSQLERRTRSTLREMVFSLLADPRSSLPVTCRSFLRPA